MDHQSNRTRIELANNYPDALLDAKQGARQVRGDIGAFSLYFQMTAGALELYLNLKACRRGTYFPVYGQQRELFRTVLDDGKCATALKDQELESPAG